MDIFGTFGANVTFGKPVTFGTVTLYGFFHFINFKDQLSEVLMFCSSWNAFARFCLNNARLLREQIQMNVYSYETNRLVSCNLDVADSVE